MKTMRMPLAALMLSLVSIASAQYHTPGTKTARSPSGRYAIQERNGRPWLLDTTKGTAQLLADDTAGRQLVAPGFPSYDAQPLQVLISAISHEPLKSAVKWHPTKDIVALDVLLERRASTVWVWSPSKGLRKIGPAELANVIAFGKLPGNAAPTLAALAKQWKGDTLLIEVEYNGATRTRLMGCHSGRPRSFTMPGKTRWLISKIESKVKTSDDTP
jgi:hypothetical protein